MIFFPNDIPTIPRKVVIEDVNMLDSALGSRYPINEIGREMLRLADGTRSIDQIAEEIAKICKVEKHIVLPDAIHFFEMLNDNYLVNLKKKDFKLRVKEFFVCVQTMEIRRLLELTASKKRYDIPEQFQSLTTIFGYLLFVMPFHYRYLFLAMLLFSMVSMGVYAAVLIIGNFIVSVAVHEYSHILGLNLVGQGDKLAFLGKKNYTVGMYRQLLSPGKDIVVSLLGPIIPFAIGLELYHFSIQLGNFELEMASYIWLSHILTLFSTDGKNILNSLVRIVTRKAVQG